MTYWARAFDWRGLELGEIISFENSAEGFQQFTRWASKLVAGSVLDAVPTRSTLNEFVKSCKSGDAKRKSKII